MINCSLANKFNDYFSTIGSVNKNKIPNTNGSYKDYFKEKDKDGNLLINCNNSLFQESYWPVSLLSTLSKIYENVLYIRLYSHILNI